MVFLIKGGEGKRRAVALIAGAWLLAVGLLATGCGGSDAGATIDTAEFVKEANAVCTDARKRVIDGGVEEQGPAGKIAAILRREADGIDALGKPSRGEQKVAAMLKAVREALALIDMNPQEPEGVGPHIAKAERLAAELDLRSCLII